MGKTEWMLSVIFIFGSIFMPIMSLECLHGEAKNGDTSTLSVRSRCAGCGIELRQDQCAFWCSIHVRRTTSCIANNCVCNSANYSNYCNLDIKNFEKEKKNLTDYPEKLPYCIAVGRSSPEYIKWKKNQTTTSNPSTVVSSDNTKVHTSNLDCLDGQSIDGNAKEIWMKSNCFSCYVSVTLEHHWFYRCLDFDAGEDCWPEGECMCSSSSNCNLDFNTFKNLTQGFKKETSARIMGSAEHGKNSSAYKKWLEKQKTTTSKPTSTLQPAEDDGITRRYFTMSEARRNKSKVAKNLSFLPCLLLVFIVSVV